MYDKRQSALGRLMGDVKTDVNDIHAVLESVCRHFYYGTLEAVLTDLIRGTCSNLVHRKYIEAIELPPSSNDRSSKHHTMLDMGVQGNISQFLSPFAGAPQTGRSGGGCMALHVSRLRDVNLPSMRHIIALRWGGLDGVHGDSTRLHTMALGLPWSPKSDAETRRDVCQRYLVRLTASKDFSSTYKWDIWNKHTNDLFTDVLTTVRFHKSARVQTEPDALRLGAEGLRYTCGVREGVDSHHIPPGGPGL